MQTVGYPHWQIGAGHAVYLHLLTIFFYFAYKCHTQSREGGGIDTTMNNRSNNLNGVYDLWAIK